MRVCMHVCVCMCVYVCVYVCMCVYIFSFFFFVAVLRPVLGLCTCCRVDATPYSYYGLVAFSRHDGPSWAAASILSLNLAPMLIQSDSFSAKLGEFVGTINLTRNPATLRSGPNHLSRSSELEAAARLMYVLTLFKNASSSSCPCVLSGNVNSKLAFSASRYSVTWAGAIRLSFVSCIRARAI